MNKLFSIFLKLRDKFFGINKIRKEILRVNEELNFKLDLLLKDSNFPKYEVLNFESYAKENRPKVLVAGYYGGGNLGDDLMLEILLEKLSKENYDITIMLAPNDSCDVTKYSKYKTIYFPVKIYEISQIGDHFDTIICGGGALIDDQYYLLENYHMTFTTALINLMYYFAQQEKIVVVYGLSSNEELENKDFIKKLRYIIKESLYFSLRDSYSLESLKKIGVETNKIALVDDIVFSSEKLLKKMSVNLNRQKKVLISFNIQEDNKVECEKVVSELVNYFENIGTSNYEINLFPYYTNKNWDYHYLGEIAKKYDDRVFVGDECTNFDELLKLIEDYDYFISGRYHIALIVNSLAKNFLLLNYDKHRHYRNKNTYLYENYEFEKNIIDLSNLESINLNFEKLFKEKRLKKLNDKIVFNASRNIENVIDNINKEFSKSKKK